MRRRRRIHFAAINLSTIGKRFVILTTAFLLVHTASALGADDAADSLLQQLAENSSTISSLIGFELGLPSPSENPVQTDVPVKTPQISTDSTIQVPSSGDPAITVAIPPSASGNASDIMEITKAKYSPNANGIIIKNNTDYEIDPAAILAETLDLDIDPTSPQILIIHTHGSECYAKGENDVFEESDPSRTENTAYNVVRVGDELASALAEYGICTLHDRTLYDYPSYSGSYTRSYESIQKYLAEYPDIKIVIDLHRDAILGSDGTAYKTSSVTNGEKTAQIMLIMGTDYSGLYHPQWRENLKLGMHLQAAMNEINPTLARPLNISKYRYNQECTTGSMIVEVGSNGNTLDEALGAIRLFAQALARVVYGIQGESSRA